MALIPLRTTRLIQSKCLRIRCFSDTIPYDNEVKGYAEAIKSRAILTGEVVVSKLFPAGFAWQASSILAGNMEFAADSAEFALTVGIGEAAGVLAGHTIYYGLKKKYFDNSIIIPAEASTALYLATGTLFSGTGWQPAVNMLHDQFGCTFQGTFLGTGIICGSLFFAGLRVARMIWPKLGNKYIEKNNYANLKFDAGLSVSIGGATAFFVGTDVSFANPDNNFLRPIVGVEESCGNVSGCMLAGTSTAMGFAAVNGAQAVVLPPGKMWSEQ